jgi:hypothetical protein
VGLKTEITTATNYGKSKAYGNETRGIATIVYINLDVK